MDSGVAIRPDLANMIRELFGQPSLTRPGANGETGEQMSNVGLRVNAPQVIHESIEGEVIIIDLGTGTYFSAKGSAAEVWDAIDRNPGASAESLATAVANAYDLPADAVSGEVQAFVSELLSEGVVVAEDRGGDVATGSIERNGTSSVPFEPPMLEKYTDMKDLVLIDPVHQVDSAGWPERQPGAATREADD